MHLLRDYVKSLTFVALSLVGYTALMLSFSATRGGNTNEAHREFHLDSKLESKTESKAETQIHSSLHSHTEASIKTAIAPEIEAH